MLNFYSQGFLYSRDFVLDDVNFPPLMNPGLYKLIMIQATKENKQFIYRAHTEISFRMKNLDYSKGR